jgi:hypothetical protein
MEAGRGAYLRKGVRLPAIKDVAEEAGLSGEAVRR